MLNKLALAPVALLDWALGVRRAPRFRFLMTIWFAFAR